MHPSERGLEAARETFKQARQELEYFGAYLDHSRGAVSAERWNIAIWDDGTIAGIYPVSGPQPAPRSDMRIVEVAPVNPQAGAVSADLPEVERLRKASDEVIGHLVARVEQLEAALGLLRGYVEMDSDAWRIINEGLAPSEVHGAVEAARQQPPERPMNLEP